MTAMASACRDISMATGESVAGTALQETTRWLLLEVAGPWAAKPLMSPGIPSGTRAHLQEVLSSVPGTRLQLIRRARSEASGVQLKVCRTGLRRGWTHDVQLPDLGQLSGVDIHSMWERDPGIEATPFILVCTHGMRDQCCARQGAPLAHALGALRPDQVWQTSHLGGHRFAATAVVLPWGIHLGRVEPEEAESIWMAVDRQELHRLDRYRGCTELTKMAQAAAIYLRSQDNVLALDGVRYLGCESASEGQSIQRFECSGRTVRVVVSAEVWGEPRATSCGSEVLKRPTRLRCAVVAP